MAKTTVTFPAKKEYGLPEAVTKVKYATTKVLPMARETIGKVRHIPGARYYFKPTLGILVLRKPGVKRESADVVAINNQLEVLEGKPEHPSRYCGGLHWPERGRCLRQEMKKAIKPVV